MSELYVVGRVIDPGNVLEWAFMGIFDSKEKAEESCCNDYYFVGPVKLNEILPNDIGNWPNAYYPNLSKPLTRWP